MNPENKLPEDFKKKWVAALRSGEYKQGTNYLYNKDNDSYCCLGVACVIVGRKKIQGMAAIPMTERRIPASLRSERPMHGKLAGMNDDGISFSEIADYIEANL